MEGISWDFFSLVRGIVGILVVILVAYALSDNRRRVDFRLVGIGLTLQLVFALSIIYIPFFSRILELGGAAFVKMMDFTSAGLSFLLGPYAAKTNGFIFLVHSLPIVIFFSALISLCYHWGIIQKIVGAFSWLLRKFVRISGAEGLVTCGNVFMGMAEAPVLIKNYVPTMNRSEIFLMMVAGMATISGGVMGTYVGMLGGDDPAARVLFAKHLLSASIMAVPGAVVVAKLLCPQTERIVDRPSSRSGEEGRRGNTLEAIASGASTGVKLMINIAAMLLVFISLVAMANYILKDLIGSWTGLNEWIVAWTDGRAEGLTFQFLLGVVTAPFMWLLGVPSEDLFLVGSLFGQKTILNEFVGYFQLQEWRAAGLFAYEKSVVMATYILCGFANIGSIGILLGGLGVLAPEKREIISRLGVRSLIGGSLVSLLSATVVGMLMG